MNPNSDKLDSPIEIDQQKSAIRQEMLAKLKSLTPADRASASCAINTSIRSSPQWQSARTILIFHPLRSEPDISPLLDSVQHDILLPRVNADGLDIHRYNGQESLRLSSYGMLEPDPDQCPAVTVGQIDLAIIPGVAFDPDSAVRLGRGGGYYDRLLADEKFNAITIGVAFEFQLQPGLPTEPHDRPVDHLITDASLT